MSEKSAKGTFQDILKSKFVRSVFLQILLIFLIVIVAIVGIAFYSFTTEINNNLIEERQKQLSVIEENISKRMEEVDSIAYNVGNDEMFFLNDVTEQQYSGYEISNTLNRYLVGNDFIQYLLFYRLSDPETVFTSVGELTMQDFWSSYLSTSGLTQEEYRKQITDCKTVCVLPSDKDATGKKYFTYVCPLPEFSQNPQAYVIMLIPEEELRPIANVQLNNCYGRLDIYDNKQEKIYSLTNMESSIEMDIQQDSGTYFRQEGKRYILQKEVSQTNGWTYVSAIRMNDIISEVANRQLLFIVLLLLLMVFAIVTMLVCIIVQYKPINNLAVTMTNPDYEGGKKTIIDEKKLLSSTFATLKGDSEQKQKFQEAYNEAQAASKAKSVFLSNMSHDIRTPMNAIIGMTEIAIKHLDDRDYVRDCLQNVRVSSQYLLDIINNVLDMSRIESGQFTMSEDVVEIPKMIYGIISILNHNLEVKSQNLIVEVEGVENEKVITDSVRLSQVFMNILSNSVKFTQNGGTIGLKIQQSVVSEDGYADYSFIFSDNGAGMSEEFLKVLFDTFTRDKQNDISKIEGTGLGMAIAKNFVEMLNGEITCDSKLGEGTVFTIVMHFKIVDDKKKAKKVNYEQQSLLIISEETAICANQVQLFMQLGAKCEYVTTVGKALLKLRKAVEEGKPYDFVLMNQNEKDKSGIVTVSQLSSISPTPQTTYVFVARNLMEVEKSDAYNNGITAFVQMPIFKSTALEILNRTLRTHNAEKDIEVIQLEGKHILLAEDNEMNRQIAIALLAETKAQVVEAQNGKEAVDAFKEHSVGFFDVILMDVQMPIMNGFEATMAIRSIAREDALTIPIYAMTANTFDEDVRQVKEAGMNGHLGKPYIPEELYELLQSAIY